MDSNFEVEVSGQLAGLPRVVAFRWQGTRYQVRDFGRSWKSDDRMNWLVRTSPAGVFRVSCALSGGEWQIERRTRPHRPI